MKRLFGCLMMCLGIALEANAQAADSLTGKFVPGYVRPTDAKLMEFYDWAKESEAAETVAGFMNSTVKLPYNIPIQFEQCGEVNAFYKPDQRAIVLCYEYLDHIHEVFSDLNRSDSETDALVAGKMYFTLYHEIGHALVDAYDLPIFTGEESVVDGLATYFLASDEEAESISRQAAEATVQFFSLLSNRIENKSVLEIRAQLADEHALDRPRFVQIACWLYGENPDRYRLWISAETLPATRAQRCAYEYAKLQSSWDTTLQEFLIDEEDNGHQPEGSRK